MNPLWNQKAVDGLFSKLSGSFRPPDTAEILAGLLGLALLAFLVWLSARLVQRRALLRQIEISRRLLAHHSKELDLAPSERALAADLIAELEQPDLTGHQVLSRPEVFRRARRLLLSEHPEQSQRLTAFSTRLPFTHREAGLLLENSAEIPAGTLLWPVSSDVATSATARADSAFQTPDEAALTSDQEDDPAPLFRTTRTDHSGVWVFPLARVPSLGQRLKVALRRPEGLYIFETAALLQQDALFLLEHSANLKRIQRRQDFRYAVAEAVDVAGWHTSTLDIGGGGLRVRELPQALAIGSPISIRFPGLPGLPPLPARLVSRDGLSARLAFTDLRPGVRDSLIRALLVQDRKHRKRLREEEPPDKNQSESDPSEVS